MLLLSIIVPIYNVEQYLERCVKSLVNQDITHDSYEIILVNDGSTDRSGEIARNLASQYENICLIEQENRGLSGARNTGLHVAKGKYVMFVDSDDYVEEMMLNGLLDVITKQGLDMLLYKASVDKDGVKIGSFGHQQRADEHIYEGISLLMKGKALTSVWLIIYLRQMLKTAGIFFTEGILHEDIDFNLRAFPVAKKVMFLDVDFYHYCVNPDSITRTKDIERRKKLHKGEFDVAQNIKKHAKTCVDKPIAEYYLCLISSMLFGAMLELYLDDLLQERDKRECVAYGKKVGVYPIKHKTLSKKSTILLPVINHPCLLKLFLKFWFKMKPKPIWI